MMTLCDKTKSSLALLHVSTLDKKCENLVKAKRLIFNESIPQEGVKLTIDTQFVLTLSTPFPVKYGGSTE